MIGWNDFDLTTEAWIALRITEVLLYLVLLSALSVLVVFVF